MKAGLWEAYSILCKTIKNNDGVYWEYPVRISKLCGIFSFQQRGWYRVPSRGGTSRVSSRPPHLSCGYWRTDWKEAAPGQRCLPRVLQDFYSIKFSVAVISVPAMWNTLYLPSRRGFPCDHTLTCILPWCICSNGKDIIVQGRKSNDTATCCFDNEQ